MPGCYNEEAERPTPAEMIMLMHMLMNLCGRVLTTTKGSWQKLVWEAPLMPQFTSYADVVAGVEDHGV